MGLKLAGQTERHNQFSRLDEARDAVVRGMTQRLRVTVIHENGFAARRVAAINVAPAIPDQKRRTEVHVKIARRAQHHSGCGFAKIGGHSLAGIVADLDMINRQFRAQPPVHGLDHSLILRAAPDVRLIRHDDQKKPVLFQDAARFGHARQKFEFGNAGGWMRVTVHDHRAIEHAVAIQKNRARRAGHFTVSHLVGVTFSLGCETSRCQRTAWKASECGVTFTGFTVGTIAQASATFAV